MDEVVILELTLFILLAVGFLVKRIHLIDASGQRSLTDLVLYLVLPCNILMSFQSGSRENVFRDGIVLLAISIGIQALCVLYGKLLWRGNDENRRICLRYATICSNSGFLGNPIAEGYFGAVGLMYASIYLIPQRVMMWSEGIATFSGEKDLRTTVKKVLLHPCVVVCVIGCVLLATGITLPQVVQMPLNTIGRCNTALSMLVIGMILADIDPKTIFDPTVIWYTVNRLVILPLIVYLACILLPVSQTIRGVAVLMTAMPAGATTSMLAAKYGRDPGFATTLVVFSTLCSIPAIMVWGAILR